jgi:hypothetical protein
MKGQVGEDECIEAGRLAPKEKSPTTAPHVRFEGSIGCCRISINLYTSQHMTIYAAECAGYMRRQSSF